MLRFRALTARPVRHASRFLRSIGLPLRSRTTRCCPMRARRPTDAACTRAWLEDLFHGPARPRAAVHHHDLVGDVGDHAHVVVMMSTDAPNRRVPDAAGRGISA